MESSVLPTACICFKGGHPGISVLPPKESPRAWGTSQASPAVLRAVGASLQPRSLFKQNTEKAFRKHLFSHYVTKAALCLLWHGEGGGYLIEDFIFNFPIPTMWSLLYFSISSPSPLQPVAGIGQSARAQEWRHVSLHSQDGIFTAIASRVALLS